MVKNNSDYYESILFQPLCLEGQYMPMHYRLKKSLLTWSIFMPTSLKPFISNLLMISPMMPLCTPSGLMAMNVRSMILKAGKGKKKGDEGKITTYNLQEEQAREVTHASWRHLAQSAVGPAAEGPDPIAERMHRPHTIEVSADLTDRLNWTTVTLTASPSHTVKTLIS